MELELSTRETGDTDVRCWGRTKVFKRCQRDVRLFFCRDHRYQPVMGLISGVSALGLIAGLYRDLLEPLSGTLAADREVLVIELRSPELRSPVRLLRDEFGQPDTLETTWECLISILVRGLK